MKKTLLVFALSTLFLTSCKKESAATIEGTTAASTELAVEPKPAAIVGKIETASFNVDGMTCEIMCASKIQKELAATEGVQKATVDFANETATIEYDAGVTSPEKLVEMVEAVNGGDSYKVSNLKSSADQAKLFQEKEKKKTRKQRKADEKAAADVSSTAKTTTTTSAKPACCSSKKACSEKKETL
jgi:copper chaperone CopZ